VGLGNCVLDGDPDPPWEGAILRGKGASHCKVKGHCMVSCVKMAKPIEMSFGLWARVVLMNHVLHGGSHPSMGGGNFGEKGRPL